MGGAKKFFFAIVSLGFLASNVSAAGFAVYEQGAAAQGQGGAFAARANNPSAIFYNPAGIAQLKGTQLSLGATSIIVESKFRSNATGATTDMYQQISYPLNLYLTHSLSEKVSIGFGAFSPFGLKTDWPENWELSTISYRSDVASIYFNPTISFRPHEKVMLGFGIDYVVATAELRLKASPLPPPQTDFSIYDGDGDGWGYNFGALFLLSDKTSLGATFRSQVKVDFDGIAESPLIIPANPPLIPVDIPFVNGPASTTLTMPPIAVLALSHQFSDHFAVEVDAQWTGWSTIQSLDLNFQNPIFNNSIPRNWDDVFAIRLGGEYWPTENLALRAGYTFDETPIPGSTVDPILQDATRDIFSFGVGYTIGFLTTDFAYSVFFLRDRDVNNNIAIIIPTPQQGTYETTAHLLGLSFTFEF